MSLYKIQSQLDNFRFFKKFHTFLPRIYFAHRREYIAPSLNPDKGISVSVELLANLLLVYKGKIITTIYPGAALYPVFVTDLDRLKYYFGVIAELQKDKQNNDLQYQVNVSQKNLQDDEVLSALNKLPDNIIEKLVLEIHENAINALGTPLETQGLIDTIQKVRETTENEINISLDDFDDGLLALLKKKNIFYSNLADNINRILNEVNQIKLSILGFKELPQWIKDIFIRRKDDFQIVFEQLNPKTVPEDVNMEDAKHLVQTLFPNALYQHWEKDATVYSDFQEEQES